MESPANLMGIPTSAFGLALVAALRFLRHPAQKTRRFLESASLHPPLAALRRFPTLRHNGIPIKNQTKKYRPEMEKFHFRAVSVTFRYIQQSFAPAGILSSTISRLSFSSPFSVWTAEISMPLES